ncbi:MAG: BACON domain-containing protein, partial [Bacteroidales bacterium]|nr:BACON domain-containing protein [Bacteroidales bacterium]
MKRLFKYIFMLPLLLVVSCVYDEGLSIEDVLKVSDNTFEFTAAGDEIEFTIESYCGWEIKCEADWVSFSDYEGDSKDVKNVLTVSENLSVNARTVQAEIVNDRYGINIKLNISQEAGVPYIKSSIDSLEYDEDGGVEEIRIESNISWEASVDVDWIELSPQSGESGVTTMTINIDRNVSVDRRSAVVNIVNPEYDIKQEISVVQSEFVPMLRVNREKIEDVSVEGSIEEIRIESNVPWEASVDVDWIELSPQLGESGVTTMTINIDRNVSIDLRSAVVNIVNSEYDIKQEISVVQSEFV